MTLEKSKIRLDLLVVERGLAPSREKARALILAGLVLVDDVPHTKAGVSVSRFASLRLRHPVSDYVSRGAHKLIGALDSFKINPQGAVALDVGASTGGFTQVLLERGARKVYALDVGHNQLDWKIRSDPRVVCIEGTNARHVEFDLVGETVDIIVMDVSFISLTKVVPALRVFAKESTHWITLIKPQFEVGREKVGKGGIVTDDKARRECVERVTGELETLGLHREGLIDSPIAGTDGNQEYLAHWNLAKAR